MSPRLGPRGPGAEGGAGRAAALLAGLIAGASLPETAFAPAAQAHERIDAGPLAARTLAGLPTPENPAIWDGLPVADQEPSTPMLIWPPCSASRRRPARMRCASARAAWRAG